MGKYVHLSADEVVNLKLFIMRRISNTDKYKNLDSNKVLHDYVEFLSNIDDYTFNVYKDVSFKKVRELTSPYFALDDVYAEHAFKVYEAKKKGVKVEIANGELVETNIKLQTEDEVDGFEQDAEELPNIEDLY